jgi:hypothetical protein
MNDYSGPVEGFINQLFPNSDELSRLKYECKKKKQPPDMAYQKHSNNLKLLHLVRMHTVQYFEGNITLIPSTEREEKIIMVHKLFLDKVCNKCTLYNTISDSVNVIVKPSYIPISGCVDLIVKTEDMTGVGDEVIHFINWHIGTMNRRCRYKAKEPLSHLEDTMCNKECVKLELLAYNIPNVEVLGNTINYASIEITDKSCNTIHFSNSNNMDTILANTTWIPF